MFARNSSRRSQVRRAARVLNEQPVQVASEELRILISRVEDLLARLTASTDPELKRLRQQAELALSNARAAMANGGAQLADQVRDIAASIVTHRWRGLHLPAGVRLRPQASQLAEMLPGASAVPRCTPRGAA